MNDNEISKLLLKLAEVTEQLCHAFENREPLSPPEAVDKADKGLCLYCAEPLDDGGKMFRGAHERCYKKVNRAINAGAMTDKLAVERGYILPITSRGGRKPAADDPLLNNSPPPSAQPCTDD